LFCGAEQSLGPGAALHLGVVLPEREAGDDHGFSFPSSTAASSSAHTRNTCRSMAITPARDGGSGPNGMGFGVLVFAAGMLVNLLVQAR
jgi:hypothetical protein